MRNTAYSYDQISQRLPKLANKLRNAKRHPILNLTEGVIRGTLKSPKNDGAIPGLYGFSKKGSNKFEYIGRTKDLARRIGSDHRSKERNKAAFTYILKRERNSRGTMQSAREQFLGNYDVRFIPESDIGVRAVFEVYATLKWRTKNALIEH